MKVRCPKLKELKKTWHKWAKFSFFALGAPAEVRSVEVIKTVGQSSLLIGWERPPLDELGCSNATFVYGYRVCQHEEKALQICIFSFHLLP